MRGDKSRSKRISRERTEVSARSKQRAEQNFKRENPQFVIPALCGGGGTAAAAVAAAASFRMRW